MRVLVRSVLQRTCTRTLPRFTPCDTFWLYKLSKRQTYFSFPPHPRLRDEPTSNRISIKALSSFLINKKKACDSCGEEFAAKEIRKRKRSRGKGIFLNSRLLTIIYSAFVTRKYSQLEVILRNFYNNMATVQSKYLILYLALLN